MTVPCRQCNTPVDANAGICPVCGAANPGQAHGPPPGASSAGAGARATFERTGADHVVIKGVDIPFSEMVMLIMKVMLAAIPAYLILLIISLVLFGMMGACFGGLAGLADVGAGLEGT